MKAATNKVFQKNVLAVFHRGGERKPGITFPNTTFPPLHDNVFPLKKYLMKLWHGLCVISHDIMTDIFYIGGHNNQRGIGIELRTIIITFQTDYHRARGNELLMVSLEVRIYSHGDLFDV